MAAEFFKWSPESHGTLLLSLSILTWTFLMSAFVWTLITGGEVSFLGLKLKGRTRLLGISGEKLKIEAGKEDMPNHREAFYENVQKGQKGKRAYEVLVEYTEPFRKKPQIFLALREIDLGGSLTGNNIDRLRLKAEDEHTDGFKLVFETWDDSIVYNAAASWIAVGEYLPS